MDIKKDFVTEHLTKTTLHEGTILGCDECYLLLKEETLKIQDHKQLECIKTQTLKNERKRH